LRAAFSREEQSDVAGSKLSTVERRRLGLASMLAQRRLRPTYDARFFRREIYRSQSKVLAWHGQWSFEKDFHHVAGKHLTLPSLGGANFTRTNKLH
jgi:hypothetical protein